MELKKSFHFFRNKIDILGTCKDVGHFVHVLAERVHEQVLSHPDQTKQYMVKMALLRGKEGTSIKYTYIYYIPFNIHVNIEGAIQWFV